MRVLAIMCVLLCLRAAAADEPLQKGVLVVESGGLAQAQVGKHGERFAHPYFWAPFILIGNWR